MSHFTLTIRTDNDAFVEDRNNAVARLLIMAAHALEDSGITEEILRDPNGNRVGKYQFEED